MQFYILYYIICTMHSINYILWIIYAQWTGSDNVLFSYFLIFYWIQSAHVSVVIRDIDEFLPDLDETCANCPVKYPLGNLRCCNFFVNRGCCCENGYSSLASFSSP